MTQTPVPYLFLRGGTSRGPYFNRADLPDDRDRLAEVLMAVIGAGQTNNIDGIGGGTAVTTKVAMLSPSKEEDIDIDYFFAQVAVEERMVDFAPTCGNILVGVGPAAIEMGLARALEGETPVRIRAVNTGAKVEAVVSTPDGRVSYAGDEVIAGVPGGAAPVALNFLDVVGSRTSGLFPTGHAEEKIDGIRATCMDVAMPMVILRAEDFGLAGSEAPDEIDANRAFFDKVEPIRLEAGRRMGLGDVTKSVVPKVGLLSPPTGGGHMSARYLMPWKCHPSLAVTGSQCLAACALAPGTIAAGVAQPPAESPATVKIEHPAGIMEVVATYDAHPFAFRSAGLVRTARLIARGEVMVPDGLM